MGCLSHLWARGCARDTSSHTYSIILNWPYPRNQMVGLMSLPFCYPSRSCRHFGENCRHQHIHPASNRSTTVSADPITARLAPRSCPLPMPLWTRTGASPPYLTPSSPAAHPELTRPGCDQGELGSNCGCLVDFATTGTRVGVSQDFCKTWVERKICRKERPLPWWSGISWRKQVILSRDCGCTTNCDKTRKSWGQPRHTMGE
jgi:hypothetical protein